MICLCILKWSLYLIIVESQEVTGSHTSELNSFFEFSKVNINDDWLKDDILVGQWVKEK